MCSFALLHPWFPPSKAPLKIGRSWVQFLLMTEWKKSNFLRRFQLFPHLTESKMCSICSFTSLISPFESTLEDWEVMSSILTHDRIKKSNFLRRFKLLRHMTESEMFSFGSFTSLISPFESTLKDWEVMSSILTHDRMKKIKFSQKISTFSTSDREQNFLVLPLLAIPSRSLP